MMQKVVQYLCIPVFQRCFKTDIEGIDDFEGFETQGFLYTRIDSQDASTESGNQGGGHKQRGDHGDTDCKYEVLEHDADHFQLVLVDEEGKKYTNRCQGGCNDRRTHIVASQYR